MRAPTDRLRSVNPVTGDLLLEIDPTAPGELERIVESAHRARSDWRRTPIEQRAVVLRNVAALLRERQAEYATAITTEMGKPIVESEAEIEKCAAVCDFYADRAAVFLADEPHPSSAAESYVSHLPLGTVLAIMPWNFPFWQVMRFAAPALMAGNTAILKHASNVPQCAQAIEVVLHDAGVPPPVFQNVFLPPDAVARLVGDRRIAAVTLTGSDRAGSAVAAAAGRSIKKCVLELGGADPFIVLADADLAAAVEVGVRARFQNAGQSCIAAKRFLIEEAVFEEFAERFVAAVRDLPVGDPAERATRIGPLARDQARDTLDGQVRRSVERGARVLCGGSRLPGRGYYFVPTVLIDVDSAMPAVCEEVFGPVAPLMRVADAGQALRVANDSPFGLGCSLWTADLDRARGMAREVESGAVFVNGMVASDPRLPFGGVKRSGYGRELAMHGIREFTNVQTVWIGPPCR